MIVKKTFWTSLISLLIINSTCFAQESIYINKDDKAPFSGYLLPEETVKTLRNNTLERDLYKTEADLRERQVKLLSDQNDRLATTLQSTSSLSTWEKIGFFSLGVLITGGAVKLAHEVYK